MKKNIIFSVDADIYEKFCIALNLTEETQDDVAENCMRWYIAKTFERASQTYNPRTAARRSDENRDSIGKAIRRIPIWASKPNQYNHKIIRAYFAVEDIAEEVTLPMMERLCSDKEHPELYVPTFRTNYSQMKIDSSHSHGKVFEDNGNRVWIWSNVEDTLRRYKNYFYQREE